jgi:hypothetical protein
MRNRKTLGKALTVLALLALRRRSCSDVREGTHRYRRLPAHGRARLEARRRAALVAVPSALGALALGNAARAIDTAQ